IIEGDSGQKNAVFTVTMSNQVDVPVTVNWATAPNTATQGIDYVGSSGVITFNPRSTTPQTISVPVIGDTVVEFNETFFVNLSGLNAQGRNVSIVDPQGSGTITDDDTATITINNREIVEGDSGQTFANFTVNLSNPVATNVTLNVVTTPDTATENEDYNRVTSSVSFAPLSTTPQTISVPVNGDNLVENDETFFVNLNSLNAGGLEGRITVNSPGIGTIIDDDFAPEITLECPCNIITEGDTLIIDAIATDEDDQVLSYKWDLDGDGDYDENITTDTSTLNIDYQKLQDLGIGVNPLEDPIYRYQGTFNVEVSDGTNTDTTSGTLKVKHKPLEKLIDLTGFDNADVSLDITLSRDASFDSIIGFYRTDYQGKIIDNQGQVIDLLPGAPGYEDAVKANLLPQELKVRDKETVTIEVDLLGGAYYAPVLTIKPTFKISDTFATIGDIVNTRLGSQSRIMRNDNIWSFEDWTDFDRDSNGNFNDIVMGIDFPQPPSCLC
ncbi:MAG TPA: hypothetical protein DD000_26655, partial [Cyanobacteria bacterium UBA11166]|nr:hypothetical protein [Cyanobacteria bacterium UBA11166]